MELLKELLFEVQQSKIPQMIDSLESIFSTIPLKVHVNDHFIERILNRENQVSESDIVSTMYRAVSKHKSYFEGLKKNKNQKSIVIKNKTKHLNILIKVECHNPDKPDRVIFKTIMKKKVNEFRVGKQFVKELFVESEVPKQPKKAHTKKFKWESQKKQLKDLEKLEKTLDAADAV